MLSSESYQKVIEKFMQSLQDGTLKPNDKIYSENQLARILGIPRAQVREVYSALSILGVLYGQQGKGTFLGTGDLRQNIDILYLMTLSANPNYHDITVVRYMLESGSVPFAAANRSEEDLRILRGFANEMLNRGEDMVEAAELQFLSDRDNAFHSRLVQSSGNALLYCLFQIVSGHMNHTLNHCWEQSSIELRRSRIQQHLDMVDALERRDVGRLQTLLEMHFQGLENLLS